MAAPTQFTTIGGNKFGVTPLFAVRSFTLQAKLAPALSEIAELVVPLWRGFKKGKASKAVPTDETAPKPDEAPKKLVDVLDFEEVAPLIAPAITHFFGKMPPDDLELVIRELLGKATMDGKPLFGHAGGDPFDLWMQGRTLDTWKLLGFALKVNYPDFFGSLAAVASRAPAAGAE